MKVAIVHDWLVGGGAERVVQELHTLYPEAPIYTSYCSDEWRKKLDDKVVTGYLQHWPFGKLRKFIPPLRRYWFRRLNLQAYDIVISSAGNGEAKDVNVRNGALHICYCHSPTHFYWRHYEQYMKQPGFGIFSPLARLGLGLLVGPLKKHDYAAAQKPDVIIANSKHIQQDIKHYYKRNSVIIHPPVAIERFEKQRKNKVRSGFVTVSRLVPNKKLDILIEACNQLQMPLLVIGRGPDLPRLTSLAGPTIRFNTTAPDEVVAARLASAEAFLFAALEDFGIAPVEAMASGTPVIAYKAGGALDYVLPGKTGLFFDEQSVTSLVDVLKQFDLKKFDAEVIAKYAHQYRAERFREEFKQLVASKVSQ